jgi:hypothetical protein
VANPAHGSVSQPFEMTSPNWPLGALVIAEQGTTITILRWIVSWHQDKVGFVEHGF